MGKKIMIGVAVVAALIVAFYTFVFIRAHLG